MHKALFAATLALAAPLAFSQDVAPGLWEITMETRVPADPGFQPTPARITQCITPQTAKDPGMLFSQMGNPGASNCRYQDRNYHAGNTFTFAMTCSGTFALRSSGQVAFTKDTMEGTVSAIANVGDKDVETTNKLSARRLGGC
ncbi:MAG TPA: DUF3617 family protein [Burkholderiales bacterium]|nr:DUF3617 family protein [Burkholderiales bacterium]